MIAAVRERNLRKRASALGVAGRVAAIVGDELGLHRSSSTQSLPAELAGDTVFEDTDFSYDVDAEKLTIVASLPGSRYDGVQPLGQHRLQAQGLGRARSRRWLESHCG